MYKRQKINAGESYIADIGSKVLKSLSPYQSNSGMLTATTQYSSIQSTDCVIICVPTPVSKTKDPDVSFIINATKSISEFLHEDMLIVLESTTYPGTTEELIVPILENPDKDSFIVGDNIFVAFSPERIDPNNQLWTVTDTPKVIGGITEECSLIAASLYSCLLYSSQSPRD